ncbi:hypothetical protein EJ04DRAFT_254034 [Polyplosphaeria fusca]|uniref:Uncharacterized protein n=1 Tax=Polyplosphaeria fusca TaxID=682080 RepID=A0A9P4QZL9_9PLEO|nr:hypothetical protein EJ04DRAFT_254034 [Polyplosphaeria fusca]
MRVIRRGSGCECLEQVQGGMSSCGLNGHSCALRNDVEKATVRKRCTRVQRLVEYREARVDGAMSGVWRRGSIHQVDKTCLPGCQPCGRNHGTAPAPAQAFIISKEAGALVEQGPCRSDECQGGHTRNGYSENCSERLGASVEGIATGTRRLAGCSSGVHRGGAEISPPPAIASPAPVPCREQPVCVRQQPRRALSSSSVWRIQLRARAWCVDWLPPLDV